MLTIVWDFMLVVGLVVSRLYQTPTQLERKQEEEPGRL